VASRPPGGECHARGGAAKTLTAVWLIQTAAAFGAVTEYTGMLGRLIAPVINWAKRPALLILVTMLTFHRLEYRHGGL
jgi:hypothetical protein